MSVRIGVLLFFAVVFACQGISAQPDFWKTKDAYLGQRRPSDTPQVFAPGLLVDEDTFPMGRVAFSADGKEFYFAQNDSWESGDHARIKMIRFADHHWRNASVIAEECLSPTLSLDGDTLYMRKIIKGDSMRNVWEAHRAADGWSGPAAYIEEPFGVYDFMPTRSGNAYVGSDPDENDKKNGITYAYSVLTVFGGEAKVRSLGRPLNEPGFNGDLYIAPDESYIIVSAKETKTFESQLYISFRKHDGSWTEPVSLGEKINGGLAHRWGQYVSPDGKYLFYTHGTSEKDCAIYWVRFDKLLARLRPKEFQPGGSEQKHHGGSFLPSQLAILGLIAKSTDLGANEPSKRSFAGSSRLCLHPRNARQHGNVPGGGSILFQLSATRVAEVSADSAEVSPAKSTERTIPENWRNAAL